MMVCSDIVLAVDLIPVGGADDGHSRQANCRLKLRSTIRQRATHLLAVLMSLRPLMKARYRLFSEFGSTCDEAPRWSACAVTVSPLT